jgi:hypothetical protein
MTVMQNRLAAATMALALATCSSAPETSKDREGSRPEAVTGQQPDQPPVAAWDHLAEGASWTATLMESLNSRGDRLLAAAPQDATAFCPGFAALDREGRRAFYVGLISKMAEFESGFDPATTFQEAFNDAQGRPVISRGLLQLSIESARAYRGCAPESAEELHDPRTNLTCTVAILQRWMS